MNGNVASGFECASCSSYGPHRIMAYDDALTIQLVCDCGARWWEVLGEG